MQYFVNDLNDPLSNNYILEDCVFCIHDFKSAVNRLNPYTKEGNLDLISDHIKNTSDICFPHVACLFTATAIHGVTAQCFLYSSIVDIPKKNHCVNKSVSANFCGNALCPTYGTILDKIITEHYTNKFLSSDMQFRFQAS